MDIELADAVEAVREQLLEAAARGASKEIVFGVNSIELEFTVELRKDTKAKLGVKAWIFSADVEAGLAHAQTHKVKVVLSPRDAEDQGVLLAGADLGEEENVVDPAGQRVWRGR
jgi:hypothetical protein